MCDTPRYQAERHSAVPCRNTVLVPPTLLEAASLFARAQGGSGGAGEGQGSGRSMVAVCPAARHGCNPCCLACVLWLEARWRRRDVRRHAQV